MRVLLLLFVLLCVCVLVCGVEVEGEKSRRTKSTKVAKVKVAKITKPLKSTVHKTAAAPAPVGGSAPAPSAGAAPPAPSAGTAQDDTLDDSGADAPVPIPSKLHRRHASSDVLEYSLSSDGVSIMIPSAIASVPSKLHVFPASATIDQLFNDDFTNDLLVAVGKPTGLGAPSCRVGRTAAGKKVAKQAAAMSAFVKGGKKSKRTAAKKRFQQMALEHTDDALLEVSRGGDSRRLLDVLKMTPNQVRIKCQYATNKQGNRAGLFYQLRSFDTLFPDTVHRMKVVDAAVAKITNQASKNAVSLVESESVAEGQDLPDPLKFFEAIQPPVDPSYYYNTNELATPAVSALYPYGGLSYANLLTWGTSYINAISITKTPRQYPTWKAVGQTGRYNAYTGASINSAPAAGGRTVRIGVAADWGSGTVESDYVAQLMRKDAPDWTMHVGDIYWAGAKVDVRTNCLGYSRKSDTLSKPRGVFWPLGRLGGFASLGNHEMYNRGDGFFDDLLPNLGLRSGNGVTGQKAGYVSVETESWIVILGDTGFKSYGGKVSVDAKPEDVALTDEQIAWLRDDVKIGNPNDKRGIVFLTHHQPVSAFSNIFTKPAQQLASLLPAGRKFVWLFGHEHILSFYQFQTVSNGVGYWGRCVGNGGFPTNVIPNPAKPTGALIAWDNRLYQHYTKPVDANKNWADEGFDKTFNGWVDLQLSGAKLTVTYKSFGMAQDSAGKWWASNSKQTSLAQEVFTVGADGMVSNSVPLMDPDTSDGAALTYVKFSAN